MVGSLDHWIGKAVVVSRACSGCGPAIIERLVTEGLTVVGLTTRQGTLDHLAEKLEGKKGKLHTRKTDNTNRREVVEAFSWITKDFGPIHVLINSGGINKSEKFLGNGIADRWRRANDTNVFALAYATREAVKDMKNNAVAGQIIHIGSVLKHFIGYLPKFNLYGATIFASKALIKTFRQDLLIRQTKIRITSIKIGSTEYNPIKGQAVQVTKVQKPKPKLQAKDVADVVAFILSTPPHVQIPQIKIIPFAKAF